MNYISRTTFIKIVKKGKKYTSINNCYENVFCDRCNKTNMKEFISWKDYDLCFYCVGIVKSNILDSPEILFDAPKSDYIYYKTMMAQNQFNKNL